jgi:hypothetical protein
MLRFDRGDLHLKGALGSLALLLATLAFLEAALSQLSARSKSIHLLLSDVPPEVSDPVLGLRLNPEFPDHDKAGFRNTSVLESAYFVALGDSQTYGTWVRSEEAWPHQLSELSKESVYNMGVPGYGPIQSLALTNQAMSLHPRRVVEAFYAGNDLYDAFSMVYKRSQFVDLRSKDPNVITAIRNAETKSRIGDEFTVGPGLPDSNPPSVVRRYLVQHSSLWGLLRAAKAAAVTTNLVSNVSPEARWADLVRLARSSGGRWAPFEKGPVRTVFTPRYRFAALDMDDPRIREGFRVSMEAMKRMFVIAQLEAQASRLS